VVRIMWVVMAVVLLSAAAGVGLMLTSSTGRPASSAAAANPLAAMAPGSDASPVTGDLPEASPQTREAKRFARVDRDRDGAVTRDEYLASRRKAFAKLDVDGDGRLTFDEWAIRSMTKFADADHDRSGALTAQEFATTAPKRKSRAACRCTTSLSDDADDAARPDKS